MSVVKLGWVFDLVFSKKFKVFIYFLLWTIWAYLLWILSEAFTRSNRGWLINNLYKLLPGVFLVQAGDLVMGEDGAYFEQIFHTLFTPYIPSAVHTVPAVARGQGTWDSKWSWTSSLNYKCLLYLCTIGCYNSLAFWRYLVQWFSGYALNF